ncbi:MAG: daunorubicin/doxorubicin resistance ABC transporter ATP-binding protein DrrA, partial [Actinomycetota bacterium]
SRIGLWDVIRELVSGGTTLLLTTQYLEEADQLADEITVIDRGQAIARGTADQLKSQIGGERIEMIAAEGRLDDARRIVERVAVGEIEVELGARRILAPVAEGAACLRTVLLDLESEGISVSDIGLRRPTLDDVFLTLTGHHAEEGTDGPADSSSEEVAS